MARKRTYAWQNTLPRDKVHRSGSTGHRSGRYSARSQSGPVYRSQEARMRRIMPQAAGLNPRFRSKTNYTVFHPGKQMFAANSIRIVRYNQPGSTEGLGMAAYRSLGYHSDLRPHISATRKFTQRPGSVSKRTTVRKAFRSGQKHALARTVATHRKRKFHPTRFTDARVLTRGQLHIIRSQAAKKRRRNRGKFA